MDNVQLYQLTDEQRLQARNEAKRVIIASYGNEPTREQYQRPLPLLPDRADYEHRTVSEYPAWLIKVIAVFMSIVFVAAALPSLFRLYRVGYDYFYMGIENGIQAQIVGVSTFLLAEFLIVLSTVAMRVLFSSKRARASFLIPIGLGLAMAFVGNWTITQPHDAMSWLETIVPPIAVLFTAMVGEQMVLHSVKTRYANERAYKNDYKAIEIERREQQQAEKLAYQDAVTRWHDATKEPEQSEQWIQAYANALRSKLIEVNSSGRGKTERVEYMEALSHEQWIDLIRFEINAEQWFNEQHLEHAENRLATASGNGASVANFTQPVAVPVMATNGNGNGTH